MKDALVIQDLHVQVEGKPILHGVNLTVRQGEVHAVMGPNGSGKSTLSLALMGHPKYKVTKGDIWVDGRSVLAMPPDERSRTGVFLAFQYPTAVPGVSVANFLRTAVKARAAAPSGGSSIEGKAPDVKTFLKTLRSELANLKLDEAFLSRALNDGFSGGEKKRVEMLQMAVLKPRFAVLDETDSGLDIDALKVVADGVNRMAGPSIGILMITHYQRLLNYVRPHFVHVLIGGRLVLSGGAELAETLEARGYDWVREGEAAAAG